jgi:hypothetical protein
MNINFPKIADDSSVQLKTLMNEAVSALDQAWEQLREEVEESDTSCVMRVGFTIAIDPSEKHVAYRLSFAARRRFESTTPLPDPAQPELAITADRPGIKRKRARAAE